MKVLGFSDLFEIYESPKTPKCMNSCGLDMLNLYNVGRYFGC